MDKQELLGKMRVGHEALETLLARVDASRMQETAMYDLWTVKDLLAHLGFWEQRVVTIYGALSKGANPDPIVTELVTMDDVNAANFKANHDRPLAEVRSEEGAAYGGLVALVHQASQADLFDGVHFAWTQGTPFFEWVASNSYGHYEEHLPVLEEWINSRG